MLIYAHRGLTAHYPENSKSAVWEAIDKGFCVEIDIRFTKDRKIVLIHDDNLLRIFNKNKKVEDLKELDYKNLYFSSNPQEKLITLEKIIEFLLSKKREFYMAIHFKQKDQNLDNIYIISELFKRYDLYRKCFLFDLSISSCKILRNLNPKIKLGVIVSDKKFEPFIYLWEEAKKKEELFDIVWCAEYDYLYTKDFFLSVKSLSKKVIAVSYELHGNLGGKSKIKDYREGWKNFIENEVDGICTDYPYDFLQFINLYVKR